MTTTRYLIIDKKDDVYLKIEADEDIRRELGQFFTFEVPGFKFMPQFRNRVWDGKIRLFSYLAKLLGFLLSRQLLMKSHLRFWDIALIEPAKGLTTGYIQVARHRS